MSEKKNSYGQLTRRALILGGIKSLLLTGAISRLFYLQVLERDRYQTLAEDNRISLKLIPPNRGFILDRYGQMLALNTQSFQVEFVSAECPDIPNTLERLVDLLGMNSEEEESLYKRVGRRKTYLPIIVRENIDWPTVSKIELAALDLPGVTVTSGDIRSYPLGGAAAHVLGYVGTVSDKDKEDQEESLLTVPGFRIGKTGLEKFHDRVLRGTPTAVQLEVNAHGRVVRELSRQAGNPGEDISLAINASLQDFTYQRLSQEKSAAAVVMDVHTGEVHAMASFPAYNPDTLVQGLSSDAWKSLSLDPGSPLMNKAISGQYAPGSTIKMIVALAALESGAINTNHQHVCSGYVNLGNHRFHCWKKSGHGNVTIVSALAQSCDVFFYDLAQRVGIDTITDMAKHFGLGDKLGLDLPEEKSGFVPTQAWKKAKFKERWQQGETLVAAIGQGYMLATPLQLAVMVARLVNGGKAVVPRLTKAFDGKEEALPEWANIDVDPDHLKLVIEGMKAVTLQPYGTAYGARILKPNWQMAGKTGTSQVRRISMAERVRGVINNKDLAWASRDHALFVGYAPVSSPRYACAVLVEHGGGGSAVAAPIARDILEVCYTTPSSNETS